MGWTTLNQRTAQAPDQSLTRFCPKLLRYEPAIQDCCDRFTTLKEVSNSAIEGCLRQTRTLIDASMFSPVKGGVCVLMLALGCWCSPALQDMPPSPPHVILITIDGLGANSLADPRSPLPTLRKLAAAGAVAEGLRVSNPTVTWANHTTLVTGVHPDKHGVLFNGLLIRQGPGQSVFMDTERDKIDLVAVPTLYDQLHAARYRTANINWPGTRKATTLDDNFPDVPNPIAHTNPRLRINLIRAGILASDNDAAFHAKGPAAADAAWTAAAGFLMRSRPPHFLLLHLLNPDAVQHRHGPQSPEAIAALAAADQHIAQLLMAINAAGLSNRTTIFITSDHGFAPVTKLISPNVILRKAGLFRPSPNRRAQVVAEGGTAFVYLTQPATRVEDRAKVIALLAHHEGIATIVSPEGFAALRLPDPARNPQMGDLLLVAKPGYAFDDEHFEDNSITVMKSPSGSHGYLATDPQMNGIFIASGVGIKKGMKLGVIENIDIAPTLAALFGQKLSNAEGKILQEILTNP